jgi:hypothetical protein
MNSFNISHFSGSGQMLTTYQPGTSIFPVAPFVLQPLDVSSNPALFTEVKRAGINTLFSGFYMNPRSTTTSYSAWESTYDQIYGGYWKWAAANGFHLYTMGDEICRGIGAEGWWTLNWPSGQQAVQHAMASLASSGVAIGTDIIDEGSMMWGATPTPFRRIGETNMFTSVVCSATTCTVNWPNNPVKPGRFFAGLQFAFTGSVNPALNTPAGQMFTATNVGPLHSPRPEHGFADCGNVVEIRESTYTDFVAGLGRRAAERARQLGRKKQPSQRLHVALLGQSSGRTNLRLGLRGR